MEKVEASKSRPEAGFLAATLLRKRSLSDSLELLKGQVGMREQLDPASRLSALGKPQRSFNRLLAPLGLDVLGEHDQDAHKEDQRMEGWVVDWTRHGCCLRADERSAGRWCHPSERSSLSGKKWAWCKRRDIASRPVGMSFRSSPWPTRHQVLSVFLLTVKGDCLSAKGEHEGRATRIPPGITRRDCKSASGQQDDWAARSAVQDACPTCML
ncbi:hypothetical protein L1887_47862 [Cichorium endivia]|nr:hypothetical protein L1887_47862 [Cichorium endivia]